MKSLRAILGRLLIVAVLTVGLSPLAWSDPNPPVAVISLVWGVVTIKHPNEDYKPARWLEPVAADDMVKTAGPGSKLLITFFSDNHQEVMGQDCEARADQTTLNSISGDPIRKDGARNPFGVGGVQNPFVYTHKLITDDFKGADADGAMDRENSYLKAHVNPAYPPGFIWPKVPGAAGYTLTLTQPSGQVMWATNTTDGQYKMKPEQADALSKGATYEWQVNTADQTQVTSRYPFMLLTLPLEKWYKEQNRSFDKLRQANKLQRSDYTDYLLVTAQLLRVDETLTLVQKMSDLDPKNPNLFRALTRVYLMKGCPAHAKQAHDTELELGGYDPIYP